MWRTITYGWMLDVRDYWHRARHGWADRDTWELDVHLARVMGGSLAHLAECSNGSPGGYTHHGNAMPIDDDDTDHDAWRADLRRWSDAMTQYATDDSHRRDDGNEALHVALKEMEPWFEALWD